VGAVEIVIKRLAHVLAGPMRDLARHCAQRIGGVRLVLHLSELRHALGACGEPVHASAGSIEHAHA
jgi:hypothetical protein